MLLLPSGPLGVGMPPELDAALREDVLKLNPDDDIVLQNGCGPGYVHLNETDYKSTRRTRMGLCYGDQTLASYGMEYSQDGAHSENVSMRHFTPLYYAVMDYVWRAWRPYLDPEFASERPDRLDVLPFRDGQFMDYHTDSRPRPGAGPDAPVAQRRGSPVLTLNLFQDMNFWFRPYPNDLPQRCVTLEDGMSSMWPCSDDHDFKHGVWPPRWVDPGGTRVGIIIRYSSRRRRYNLDFPFRVILSEAEQQARAAFLLQREAKQERKREGGGRQPKGRATRGSYS